MDGPEPQFQYPRHSRKGKRAHPHAPRTLTLSSEPDAVLTVPKEFLPVMIGAGGRNICLVVKYAQVFVQSNEEGQVQVFAKNSDSSIPLAKRMIASIIGGGVLRWFTHPSSTHKYYHPSVRAELQDLVSSQTGNKCALQLLRANTGHMCLFIMPLDDAVDEKQVCEVRPILVAKITELASLPKEELASNPQT